MVNTKTTRKQRAYNYIRQGLMTGRYAAGSRLSDVDISRQLNMSRTPVRQAIQQLQGEGLIDNHPKGGFIIRRPEPEEILEQFDMREMIEGHAAEKAAEMLNDEQLRQLEEMVGLFRAAAHTARLLNLTVLDGQFAQRINELDARFHLLIIRSTGNEKLRQMVQEQRIMVRVFGYRFFPHGESCLRILSNIYRHHRSLVRALHRRDGRLARHLMVHHLRDARERLQRHREGLADRSRHDTPSAPEWPDTFRVALGELENGDG